MVARRVNPLPHNAQMNGPPRDRGVGTMDMMKIQRFLKKNQVRFNIALT